MVLPREFVEPMLDSIVEGARRHRRADGGRQRGAPRGAARHDRQDGRPARRLERPQPGPTQCHDITVYPAIGLAGGACGGYGLLLDIQRSGAPEAHRRGVRLELLLLALGHVQQRRHQDPVLRRVGRRRPAEVPRHRQAGVGRRRDLHARPTGKMQFQSYYKMPAPQTPQENCVAHNGSLIPIPGPRRDGAGLVPGRHLGVRLDRRRAPEGDRLLRPRPGGLDPDGERRLVVGLLVQRRHRAAPRSRAGSTSSSSRRARSSRRTRSTRPRSVHLDYLNAQGQPKIVWPPSFALARAYLDQLERSNGLDGGHGSPRSRQALASAEKASGAARRDALTSLATRARCRRGGRERRRHQRRRALRWTTGRRSSTLAGAVRELAGAGAESRLRRPRRLRRRLPGVRRPQLP